MKDRLLAGIPRYESFHNDDDDNDDDDDDFDDNEQLFSYEIIEACGAI